ncbi:DUF3300 domain-containing protein [Aureimonas fodinaquatilis]|uniref:DUF3300 domain-containing protein n=2 Tax=Aureimonas fodinaquatilis TaxID=2565783 RepID=A0A5B0DSK2_9HYPH|nr:DUF3300 domain-containing protein [Aureimonas fodinaquatilis]KAA0969787.1 DUF3300 domain-containing protein [Aureimonas fodinaquatilis]
MRLHGLSPFMRVLSILVAVASGLGINATVRAQQTTPVAAAGNQEDAAPDLLTADELAVLVARITLYPDELVALISSASVYPLQIIEAERFLEQKKTNADLVPKDNWDDSVISLLNYPDIVKMMSDDLDWTQALGSALAYQQKDVLMAIQDLRDKAVANGIIKTDDKLKVETEGEAVVIRPVDPEKIYVPKYEPEMLYQPGYVQAPIGYYSEPYPSYYYPSAPYFAAAITGAAIWAAAVDWDDWGVWGGRWHGDVDVDCDRCFNNIDINRDKFKMGDVDWKNIDRSKIRLDKNQLANIDRGQFKNEFKASRGNNLATRAREALPNGGNRVSNRPQISIDDVRKSKAAARQTRPERERAASVNRGDVSKAVANRPAAANRKISNAPKNVNRKVTRPKPGGQVMKPGNRSAIGNVGNKRQIQMSSSRGRQSMHGGGHRRPQSMGSHRGGGGRAMPHGGGRRR